MLVRSRTISLAARTFAFAPVLGLFLLAPALACAGSATSGEGAPSQADLIDRLPADAMTLGFIDFMALRESPVYDFAQQEGESSAQSREFREFVDRTGIDPRRDLHRIAFSTGKVESGASTAGAAIVVATFDRALLEETLAGHESDGYGDYAFWSLAHDYDSGDESEGETSGEEQANDGFFVTILDADTLAFGSRTALESVIDVAGGAASARANRQLMALLEDVDPGSEVWVVSAQDRLLAGVTPGGEGRPTPQIPIDKIQSMILSIHLADGIELELRGRTAAKEDAQLLGDSLNGMLAFGKMMLQSNSPEVFAILDRGIRAGSSGQDVTLRANLSMDDLRALRAFARETVEGEGADIGS